eukprot:594920-Rhodomonas_salina.1
MACEVAMGREGERAGRGGGGGFGLEEGAQMAKRVCMLTYVLHRCGRAGEALAWAAAVTAMLVRGGDMAGATRALEEYYTLLGGVEEEVGAEGGGVLVGVLEGVEESVRVQALQLELRVGMRAKRPPVKVRSLSPSASLSLCAVVAGSGSGVRGAARELAAERGARPAGASAGAAGAVQAAAG